MKLLLPPSSGWRSGQEADDGIYTIFKYRWHRHDSNNRFPPFQASYTGIPKPQVIYSEKAVMIEKMLTCLKRLSPEKQKLITALFFDNKSEHQVSRETGVPQRTIHDRKIKILAKLKRLMYMRICDIISDFSLISPKFI